MGDDLSRRTVVVTRADDGWAPLTEAFRASGATVLHLPTVEIGSPEGSVELESSLDRLTLYHWIVFTSRNAVRSLADRGVRLPSTVRVAAVGPSTASHAREAGYDVELVGDGTGAEALAHAMIARGIAEGSKVFFPTSGRGRPDLDRILTRAGAVVDRVVAYETKIRPFDPASLPDLGKADFVTFTSPSAVEGWVSSFEEDPASLLSPSLRYVVIGETTARAAEERGLDVIRARETSFEGVVATVRELAGSDQAGESSVRGSREHAGGGER